MVAFHRMLLVLGLFIWGCRTYSVNQKLAQPAIETDTATALNDEPDSGEQLDSGSGDAQNNNPDTDNAGCVQDYDGHDACRATYGESFYCGPSNECIEASACEAEDCCIPGRSGDNWCQSIFGECSSCFPGEDDGYCTPVEC